MNVRIGHGYDVHKFVDVLPEEGNAVTLGGIQVPHDKILLAHSDGDVVVHALCDAILGAMGDGDIGQHFPDDDPRFENVDSCLLLSQVLQQASKAGWKMVNTDMTVVAQAPRLAPFIPDMRSRLATLLELDRSCVNIKATTTEGLGFTGREEGMACHAVVLLARDMD